MNGRKRIAEDEAGRGQDHLPFDEHNDLRFNRWVPTEALIASVVDRVRWS